MSEQEGNGCGKCIIDTMMFLRDVATNGMGELWFETCGPYGWKNANELYCRRGWIAVITRVSCVGRMGDGIHMHGTWCDGTHHSFGAKIVIFGTIQNTIGIRIEMPSPSEISHW